MKTYYKINEISKLYNIGCDSLRYYEEQGILHPRRSESNYRLYTTSDIYRLNIIKDLRNLGFSMKRIKEYLENRSIAQSKLIMEEEERLIDQKIAELKQLKKDVIRRRSSLSESQHVVFEQMEVIAFNERKCVSLKTDAISDDTEYLLMKLSKEYEKNIYTIANFHTGFFLDATNMDTLLPTSVFIVGETLESYEFLLPAGNYLTLYYQGEHTQTPQYLKAMMSYCKEQGYRADPNVMQFCIIDAHETKHQQEYITQLQIRIKENDGNE